MSAAAKLDRIVGTVAVFAEAQDTNFIAIFLAKERHGAGFNRGVRRHQLCFRVRILLDNRVHFVFDFRQLFACDGAAMADVKTDPVGIDHLALLRDVIPKNAAQRFMHDVRGGVIALCLLAPVRINADQRYIPNGNLTA